ncbi:hypothetical protein CVT26_004484 [Gymnopilus dilepis]|uniref:Uncharacterized protein n=1 Tax=Gymnopilus dilepis TaxID=231916 RepID=A0A409WDT1_9AGAR|nr:hypothetical protein CVT26_004484 [Gymnopilus dilepis]
MCESERGFMFKGALCPRASAARTVPLRSLRLWYLLVLDLTEILASDWVIPMGSPHPSPITLSAQRSRTYLPPYAPVKIHPPALTNPAQ